MESTLRNILVGTVRRDGTTDRMDSASGRLGPNFYDGGDNVEYAQRWRKYPESKCDVLLISHHITFGHDISGVEVENSYFFATKREKVPRVPKFFIATMESIEADLMHILGKQGGRMEIDDNGSERPSQFNNTSRREIMS